MEQNKSNSNISKHLPSPSSGSPAFAFAFAFAPPQLDSIKCAPPRCHPSPSSHHGRLSHPALRFTSTTWVDFLNELSSALGTRHSTLGYEINDFSANFQQFAFWPRPGTARQPYTSKSKAEENFLTKCQVSCW